MFDLLLLGISFLLLLFLFLALVFCYFYFWKPIKNISEKMDIPKTTKRKNAGKTKQTKTKADILTRATSTIVFTNSVLFFLLVFFKVCIFVENTIKKEV